MRQPVLILLLLLGLLVAGCNNRAVVPTQVPSTPDAPVAEATTEGEVAPDGVATPVPLSPVVTSEEIVASPPAPEPDKTTIVGHLLSEQTGEPLANISVRLADVYRDQNSAGNFVLDTAFGPATATNANGGFIFTNIAAIEYVIVVGDIERGDENAYVIIPNAEGTARVWSTEAGSVLDVEDLRVTLD